MSARRCPACDGDAFADWHTADDPTGRVPGTFAIQRCAGCGLGALHPQPDDATLAAAYGSDYGPHSAPGEGGGSRRIPAGRAGRALVIGAGGGANCARLQRAGWTATGIEPHPEALAQAQAAGVDVRSGTAEVGPFPDGPFDLVWLPSVLEHVRDPVASLRNAAERCAPDGRIVVWTQNPDSHSARRWGRDWVHLDPPRHLWHFSEAALRALAGRVGLQVTRLRTRSRPRGHLSSAAIRSRRAGGSVDHHRSRWHKAWTRPRCWLADWAGAGDLWDAEFRPRH